jgi:hypothetical protein
LIDLDLFVVKLTSGKSNRNLNVSRSYELSSPRNSTYDESFDNKGSGKKLDFQQFLKVLEFVAMRINPEIDEDIAIQVLIEKYLLKLGENQKKDILPTDSKVHLKRLMEILKDNSIV